MASYMLALILIANMKDSVFVNAVCGANRPLCENAPQIIENDICISQTIPWRMSSCCSGPSIEANECPSNPQPTCRVVELKTPFGADLNTCCANMAIDFSWFTTPTNCCRTCSCFGDPHCISFDDKVDSWILCDGRTKNPDAVYGKNLICPIKRGICETQLDHMGRQCVYKDNGKETTDENGSPCQTGSSEPATMIMYKIEGFEMLLYLADRGLISAVAITNGDETYYTKSSLCAASNSPWRSSMDGVNQPNDPNWLPSSWKSSNIKNGKLWKLGGFQTGIEIEMRCVFNAERTITRINVDALSDPLSTRPDQSGVCVTGEIDKMQSTYQHTYDIQKYCRKTQTEGESIEYFCGKGMLGYKAKCMRNMCNSFQLPAAERDICVEQIIKYQNDQAYVDGWERIWCTYNILSSKDPAECTEGPCLQCMYDVYDFGWKEAVSRWKGFVQEKGISAQTGPCIQMKDLNASLTDCQNGITFQYLDPNGMDENGETIDCWVDFLSIPEGRNICGGNLIKLSSLADEASKQPNFFDKQIRIKQCNNRALCETGELSQCKPEFGVAGNIKLIPDEVNDRGLLYWQLIRENKLVCSPEQPNCFDAAYGDQFNRAKCSGCDYCPTK